MAVLFLLVVGFSSPVFASSDKAMGLKQQAVAVKWLASELTSLPKSRDHLMTRVGLRMSVTDRIAFEKHLKARAAKRPRYRIQPVLDYWVFKSPKGKLTVRVDHSANVLIVNEAKQIKYNPKDISGSLKRGFQRGAKTAEWRFTELLFSVADAADFKREDLSGAFTDNTFLSGLRGDLMALIGTQEFMPIYDDKGITDLLSEAGLKGSGGESQQFNCGPVANPPGSLPPTFVSGKMNITGMELNYKYESNILTLTDPANPSHPAAFRVAAITSQQASDMTYCMTSDEYRSCPDGKVYPAIASEPCSGCKDSSVKSVEEWVRAKESPAVKKERVELEARVSALSDELLKIGEDMDARRTEFQKAHQLPQQIRLISNSHGDRSLSNLPLGKTIERSILDAYQQDLTRLDERQNATESELYGKYDRLDQLSPNTFETVSDRAGLAVRLLGICKSGQRDQLLEENKLRVVPVDASGTAVE